MRRRVASAAGALVGATGASARTSGTKGLGRLVVVYVEVSRNTRCIVQLFFIVFGMPAAGLKLDESTAADFPQF